MKVLYLFAIALLNGYFTVDAQAAKHLKPISDEKWKSIAGSKLTESYSVLKGDTLSGISRQLFGDPKYWPKIWAMNNNQIKNPHRIVPGNLIAFSPPTGNSLPEVSIETAT